MMFIKELETNELKYSLIDYNTMFLIQNIKVNCTEESCTWVGKVEDLESHLISECYISNCSRCKARVSKKDLDVHLNHACPYRNIKCP